MTTCVICGSGGADRFSMKHPCCSKCWNDDKKSKLFEKSLKKYHPEFLLMFYKIKKDETCIKIK
jgi:hypothetical protein